jgi:hypothetical protein
MKNLSNKVIYLCCIVATLCTLSCAAFAKPSPLIDFRTLTKPIDVTRMQEYHLQNARLKIRNEQFAYAWGDLAYILCQIPNHHVALQQMFKLAPRLHKEDELRQYVLKAKQLYPDDKKVQAMYNSLHSTAAKDN